MSTRSAKQRHYHESTINDEYDVDHLLERLTSQELDEFNRWVDPDDAYLPASERGKAQTDKKASPNDKFDREHLLRFLEQKALQEKDWDEAVPFRKETRGRVYQAKEIVAQQQQHQRREDDDIEVELDDDLEEAVGSATERELVDLAAFMGMHGLLNQVQFSGAQTASGRAQLDRVGASTLTSVAKAEALKFVPPEPDNQVDVDGSIQQV